MCNDYNSACMQQTILASFFYTINVLLPNVIQAKLIFCFTDVMGIHLQLSNIIVLVEGLIMFVTS